MGESRFSRRQILNLGAMAGWGVWASPLLLHSLSIGALAELVDPDVIVLGAGMAGASAARTLSRMGLRVLVLEGSSRIGGRLCSVTGMVPGRSIELGGELIHVSKQSDMDSSWSVNSRQQLQLPIWDDLEKLRVDTTSIHRHDDSAVWHSLFDKWKSSSSAGKATGVSFAVSKLKNLHTKINDYAHQPLERSPDMNAIQWRDRIFSDIDLSDERQSLRWDFVTMMLQGHVPQTLENISIRGLGHDNTEQILGEPFDYMIPDGLATVVDRLLVTPNVVVMKEAPVSEIRYENNAKKVPGVEIVLRDGRRFRAAACVCTFSTNMINSGRVRFSPELPEEKSDAFSKMLPGISEKFAIHFKTRFWEDKSSGMPKTAIFNIPDKTRLGGGVYFNQNFKLKSNDTSGVLTALNKAEDVLRHDRDGLIDHLKVICADLDRFFKPRIRAFDQVVEENGKLKFIKKSWIHDEFAMGCSSVVGFSGPQVDTDTVRERMVEPTTAPLFWAGEATSIGSTRGIHGAHLSGKIAAGYVRDYFRLIKKNPGIDVSTLLPKVSTLKKHWREWLANV